MAALGGALALLVGVTAPAFADAWSDFVAGLWPEAEAQGVSRATFDAAFRGLKPDYSLPDLIVAGRKRDDSAGQAEFTKSALEYLNPKYLSTLAVQGRKFLKEHEKDILNIEKNTGVDRYIMVAIWGRETAYGTHKLPHDAIRVLATQAFTGRRKDEFRLEIIAARLLGRRRRADAVHADGILQAPRGRRRRRQSRYLRQRARRARLGRATTR
jgi:membrane-bound lytic murein transglycosylase B